MDQTEDECGYAASLGSTNVDKVKSARTTLSSSGYTPPDRVRNGANVRSIDVYRHMYWRSINDAEHFWKERAVQTLRWERVFNKVQQGSFEGGDISWFLGGKLNACDNCVDRWAEQFPTRTALICEADNPTDSHTVSYKELLSKVCRFANMLKSFGVKKGDIVTVYLPMIPEVVYTMLACARIGAIHCVVFAGLSAQSLAERLKDTGSQVLITATTAMRGGRTIHFKRVVDEALTICNTVEHVIVFRRPGENASALASKEVSGNDLLQQMRPYSPVEIIDSEDILFVLYTSGSTGKPKGITHTTAGYLLYAALVHQYVFDHHQGDVFGCVADCGWITGHSYVVYGPLCNGGTTVLFQSVPTYPNAGRYWEMVQTWKVTQFYTAPTAIRELMRHGDEWPSKYDLSSLRVLGTVGEPINTEAWEWYYQVIGRGCCSVVDTYWQTETGGPILAPFPGAIQMKPGCVTVPFFGIEPIILDPQTGAVKHGRGVDGILCLKRPWPGICRTVFGAHDQMERTYFHPSKKYFITGDEAFRDGDGHYWITGRMDDALNVSGHRFSTAEIEQAILHHVEVAEAAVVGVPHDVKGTAICAFVVLKTKHQQVDLHDALKRQVRKAIGPIATPDFVVLSPGLPKTRSGKIMRRILSKICSPGRSDFGDLSTLINPEILENLRASTRNEIIKQHELKSSIT